MKIAAVVVTFNRIELLKESILSLRSQTYKFDNIVVVNNSSTDGTLDWLGVQTDLTVITQDNLGSGGGQHTGIKYAYENGCDWIWCMDDDLVLYPDCIQTLVDFLIIDNFKIGALQPLKLSNPDGIIHHGAEYIDLNKLKIMDIYDNAKTNGYYLTNSFCFEGVLINKDIVKTIGLPRKDFFITNDDREYALRIMSCFPDVRIVLLGQVLMKRLRTQSAPSISFVQMILSVSEWEIFLFQSYFRNFFLAIQLNFPDSFRKRSAFFFILKNYKWVIKIILAILLFHKNKYHKIMNLFSSIVIQGILKREYVIKLK